MKTACPMDLTYFPYDRQKCFINITTGTYDKSMVDLVVSEDENDINIIASSAYFSNKEWDIVSANICKSFSQSG